VPSVSGGSCVNVHATRPDFKGPPSQRTPFLVGNRAINFQSYPRPAGTRSYDENYDAWQGKRKGAATKV